MIIDFRRLRTAQTPFCGPVEFGEVTPGQAQIGISPKGGLRGQLLVDLFMQDWSAAKQLIFACFGVVLCVSGGCISSFPFNQD